MKKLFFALCVAAIACSCGNNGVNYTIKGDLANLVNGSIYLVDYEGNPIDSATVEEGKFTFKGTTEQETGAYLLQYPTFMTLVMLENGTVNVSGNADAPEVSGSPANDGYQNMIKKWNELQQSGSEVTDSLETAVMTEAFKENKENIFGVYLMQNMMFMWSAQELMDAYNSLPAKYKNRDEMVQVKERAEKMLATQVGEKFVDIEMKAADGEAQKLSSYVEAGNYVLLDFWASWCSPCMNEVPFLVEAYGKYHDKGFEIFGVSLDNDAATWVKTYVDNGMDWIHVSELTQWDCSAAKEYGVMSIPANYLISPDGTIIAKNLRGEELENKLAEIFE